MDLVRGFVLDTMCVEDTQQQQEEQVDLDEIRQELQNTDDIIEQADILQFLYKTRFAT